MTHTTETTPAPPSEREAVLEELNRMVFAPSSILEIDDYVSTITLSQHKRIQAALTTPAPGSEREAVLEDAVKQALLQVEKYAEFFCEEDFDPLVDQLRSALTTPAPAVSTDEIVAALFKSQSFSAGHGPVGEFVTLNFPNRADREAFLEAYIAALKSKPAILSRIRGEGE